jgi:four helix bundle protein
MRNFREYDIWKDGMSLVKDVYVILKVFPKIEQFVLVQQMMRCAISIPSNIAEGSAKESQKDFARFLEIALASSYELETQLILSSDLKYVDDISTTLSKLRNLQMRIAGFIKKLKA